MISDVRRNLSNVSTELLSIHLDLSNTILPVIWRSIDKLAELQSQKIKELKTARHLKKFDCLSQKVQNWNNRNDTDVRNVVHNISSKELDEHSVSILSKGFNFAVVPSRIPVEEIITKVEAAVKDFENVEAETVRQEVSHVLKKSKLPKRNVTYKELKALKELKGDNSIVVLPADKGNATVIMDTEDYKSKIETLLQDPIYKIINSDPTTYLEKTTKAVIKECILDKEIQKKLIPREKSSKCPKFYGLPKIHKNGVPLRPIVSSIDSPTQKLAGYVAKILQPFVESSSSYIKNSTHFIDIIRGRKLKPTDIMVSFDVESLFTKVPIEETLNILANKHMLTPDVVRLTKHCLTNTYFLYDSKKYKQTKGAPMGSPISPAIANLFMDNFETNAIQESSNKPELWLRYVDDIFSIWPHGDEALLAFLNYLNNIHPQIKFTTEVEVNGKLPFLDVLLIRKPDGSLGHTVYRKQTHTNRYLHANSHHHPQHLNSVLKTLLIRSARLTDSEHIHEEMNLLNQAFKQNGFSRHHVMKAKRMKQRSDNEVNDKSTFTVSIPYFKGTTEKISNILKKHNIRVVSVPVNKVKSFLRSPKDIIPLEDQGIYEIPCGGCNISYVGQTNRRISARREEHKLAVRKGCLTYSLAEHHHQTGHKIDFENTRMLGREKYLCNRLIREQIEIERRPSCINKRDDGKGLPNTWKPLLTLPQDRRSPNIQQIEQQNMQNNITMIPIRNAIGYSGPATRSRSKSHRN